MSRGIDTRKVEGLGEVLKARRARLGKTQKEMAALCGYSDAIFISNWERGMSSPPPNRISQVARAYNIPVKIMIDIYVKHFTAQLKGIANAR